MGGLHVDEITYVENWDRVIKALADEGYFHRGMILLTGSDTLILKKAAMRFPGRRGDASKTDFHVYPLSFSEYIKLISNDTPKNTSALQNAFNDYIYSGGYLRAINDIALNQTIGDATYTTYEQWIRGDILRQGKNEETLLAVIQALIETGVSQISYSKLTQKIGIISKDTLINYCNLLERMDVLMHLQAYDQTKKQGFPRKDRKFHFCDPFILRTLHRWLTREGRLTQAVNEGTLVEATIAAHCQRAGHVYYFKGKGEVDVILRQQTKTRAIEVKWAEQIRPNDLKSLKQFSDAVILTKKPLYGEVSGIKSLPVYDFLSQDIADER